MVHSLINKYKYFRIFIYSKWYSILWPWQQNDVSGNTNKLHASHFSHVPNVKVDLVWSYMPKSHDICCSNKVPIDYYRTWTSQFVSPTCLGTYFIERMRSDVDQSHPLIAYPTTQDPTHHVDLLIASVDAKKILNIINYPLLNISIFYYRSCWTSRA